MVQHEGEDFKTFLTRLKACADDCDFVCPHDEAHSLTEYHLINRIRSGISDSSLQQELLQKSDTMKTLNEISAYCENYESAKIDQQQLTRDNTTLASITSELTAEEHIAAISAYKQNKKKNMNSKTNNNSNTDGSNDKEKCRNCGYDWPHRGKCPAKGNTCNKCHKMNHFESVCKSTSSPREISAIISAIHRVANMHMSNRKKKSLPRLKLKVKRAASKHDHSIKIDAVADTGAEVTVGGEEQMKQLHLGVEDLSPPEHSLQHAAGKSLEILGTHTIYIYHNDQVVKETMYFVKGVANMYLSLDGCIAVKIVHKNFPNCNTNDKTINANLKPDTTSTEEPKTNVDKLNRALPIRPETLPYPPNEENAKKLEQWLLKSFTKTTFNTVDPLPHMNKPMKIHLKKDAVPHKTYTPISTPINLREEMSNQLKEDVRAKVLRKCEVGEVEEWCASMFATTKKDGHGRRTVDYQKLNEQCEREAYQTAKPFHVVSKIPPKMYKTVMDAHTGYHQVILDEDSVKLTTFMTDLGGRYQSLRAPQGFKGSGDAFNRRFDDIIVDVPRKGRVVDDTIIWDQNIEQAFYHTFDFLITCAKNGITLKPQKFKFARREVDFCSYTVGWDGFRPSDEAIAAIRDFPMPDEPTLTDIKSWFGLVNQHAPFIAKASMMTPFRDLLKSENAKGNKVYWDADLQNAFEQSKDALCGELKKGLQYYDMKKETVLITDWSKLGIGFVLLQKHCKCSGDPTPLCCETGWKLCLCNSRHLDPTEQRSYAPIEGEALAVAWALKKARVYLLGCHKFSIFVDHAPLLKIFGDKSLADIENSRLLHFKRKTLSYHFEIKHIKGLTSVD
jgi:hypothetical protein